MGIIIAILIIGSILLVAFCVLCLRGLSQMSDEANKRKQRITYLQNVLKTSKDSIKRIEALQELKLLNDEDTQNRMRWAGFWFINGGPH